MAARQILWTGLLTLWVALSLTAAVARAQTLERFTSQSTPELAINALASPTNDPTPILTGTAATATGDAATVTVTVTGGAAPYVATAPVLAGVWALALPPLAQGAYTASVAQVQKGVTVHSSAIAFVIDLTPPALTLSAPPPESVEGTGERLEGDAGVAAGDLPAVTVQVYAGSSIVPAQVPVETIIVQASGATWSATVAGLPPGVYSVRAEQSDEAGNVAVSAEATFTVLAAPAPTASSGTDAYTVSAPAPAPTPPTASFTWLPATPHVDEPISMLSTSTPGSSPLSQVEWATTAAGPYELLGVANRLTFAKPGRHVVRMQVTAADGLTATVSKVLDVLPRKPQLMSPFPVVQLAGSYSRHGVRLKQFRVEVPLGTRVTVSCVGHGCPMKWERYRAAGGHGKLVPVAFHGFERSFPAGVQLRVTVYQPEEIGKMTQIYIRSGRPPRRVDTCVNTSGKHAVSCPT